MQKMFQSVPSVKRSHIRRHTICNARFLFEKIIYQNEVPLQFLLRRSVQTYLGPFQRPIRYRTFHFQQRSGAVLFRSRNCFESSVLGVNRSPIWYTFCDAPFHYPVQCEHGLKFMTFREGCFVIHVEYKYLSEFYHHQFFKR